MENLNMRQEMRNLELAKKWKDTTRVYYGNSEVLKNAGPAPFPCLVLLDSPEWDMFLGIPYPAPHPSPHLTHLPNRPLFKIVGEK